MLLTITLLVLFAAGTALVGASHQVVWLMSGRNIKSNLTWHSEVPGLLANAKDAARRTQSRNNLKQFGLAFHNHHDVWNSFPPGGTIKPDGVLLHGWAIPVGPYVSYLPGETFDCNQSWKSKANESTFQCQMYGFLNPSQEGRAFDDEGFGLCHYAGNVHVLPILTVDYSSPSAASNTCSQRGVAMSDITDGTSNTILLGTVAENFKPWGHPTNVRDPALGINRSPIGFGGPSHWRGAQFAMCDGSVRFYSEKTDPDIMAALGTIDGGEQIDDIR